jgi:hypothetical protein
MLGGVFAVQAIAEKAPIAIAAHSCSWGYTHAVINGAHKCLRRGQYCAVNADAQYHRYGFHCHRSSRDRRGRYHLT